MKIRSFLYLLLIVFIFLLPDQFAAKKIIILEQEWGKFFDEVDRTGTFVLTKLNSDTLRIYNGERSEEAFLPASTFKILNSLISLESKVIADENEIIKWDGINRSIPNWNQDMNLRNGIKYSCVWFYQELARKVGQIRMQKYLDTVEYGNSKMGAKIDNFWLQGDLRISAKEQVIFLTHFLNKNLPFSERNLDIVKNILLVDSSSTYKLFAKTGWTARVDNEIGWYVGFVISNDQTWIFAMNVDIINSSDAENREEITRKILKLEGLIY